ncbi:MAG: hypothetical protein WCJ35_00095 [Planctomycetota bacterium]
MTNKLPILLALVLMVAAAMPWLRSLEPQRWILSGDSTTVPPPERVATQSISSGSTQSVEKARDTSFLQPLIPSAVAPIPQATQGQISSKISATDSGVPRAVDISQSTLPKPQALLESAVQAVETRRFISARIKQQGELFGQQITGEGRYYELRQGPIPRIHLELTVEVGSVSTSLVQVCNGTTFWTYRKLPNAESLSKLDAVRAITALEQAASKLPREAIASSPGLGGLVRLIRGLNAQFEFTSVVADQLGGLPVWKLSGGWKPAQLVRLLPNQKEAIEKSRPLDLTRLPGHLPDGVSLFLGQEDCFPYRIDYLRSAPKSSPRRLVGLEFFELNFNGPIDSGQFLFTPGSLEIIDRTEEFVRSLGVGG